MTSVPFTLGRCVTPGYASDLKQLYGEEWLELAAAARTPTPALIPTLALTPNPNPNPSPN